MGRLRWSYIDPALDGFRSAGPLRHSGICSLRRGGRSAGGRKTQAENSAAATKIVISFIADFGSAIDDVTARVYVSHYSLPLIMDARVRPTHRSGYGPDDRSAQFHLRSLARCAGAGRHANSVMGYDLLHTSSDCTADCG